MSEFRKAKVETSQKSTVSDPVKKEDSRPVEGLTSGGKAAVETKPSDLFATYEESQGKPYVADYFEIEGIWNKQPELKRELKEIEGYVREQVTKKKLANSTRAVEKFIKEMERKAGLSRYENVNQRITKILAYIDFRKVVDGSSE